MLATFFWDPDPVAFKIPYIDHPVAWYGILFVTGFILGYIIVYNMFTHILTEQKIPSPKQEALYLTDRLTWYTVIATIVGARLGLVLFYDPFRYLTHPVEILKIWKGGLASHGAIIGILIALFLYSRSIRNKYPHLGFVRVVDIVSVPAALAAFFIRMGNFMNQEIIGIPTSMPWAVVFGHPADGSMPEPRHPIQLYEGFSYLLVFIFLYSLWKRFGMKLKPGMLSGLLFILVNTSRFFWEFLKSPQHGIMQDSHLQTGQYLSIPFIILGLVLFFYGSKFSKNGAIHT